MVSVNDYSLKFYEAHFHSKHRTLPSPAPAHYLHQQIQELLSILETAGVSLEQSVLSADLDVRPSSGSPQALGIMVSIVLVL